MKKLIFAVLTMALASSVLTGCGKKDNMDPTTAPTTAPTTTPTTSATSPTVTTPAIEEIIPTVDSMPTTPSEDATEAPSTIAPEGGTGSENGRNGDRHRSMGMR